MTQFNHYAQPMMQDYAWENQTTATAPVSCTSPSV